LDTERAKMLPGRSSAAPLHHQMTEYILYSKFEFTITEKSKRQNGMKWWQTGNLFPALAAKRGRN